MEDKKFQTKAEEKKHLLNHLEECFKNGQQHKKAAEATALININFITGKQHVQYNIKKNIIEDLPVNEHEYKEVEVFNRIRPFRNTVISKVKDKIPVPQVLPNSQDDEDMDAAKATDMVLKDLFERQRISAKLKKAAIETIDIGPSFLHVKWEPKAGQILISDVNKILGDASALFTPEQKQEMMMKLSPDGTLRNGEVVVENVSMYEIYVANPYEQELQEQEWIIRAKIYDKKYLEKVYGVEFNSDDAVGKLTHQPTLDDSENYVRNLGVYGTEKIEGKVLLKEYYEKPSLEHPDGRYILFGGGQILKEDVLPYVNGEYGTRQYPFVKIYLDTPGLFYSHAFIEDLKSVQRRYNQVRNRKYEYINKNVNGQLIIEDGAIPDDAKITNKPGDIIWYNRGFRPPTTIVTSSTATLDVDSELNSLGNEFVQTVGISTLSVEGTPATSGIRGASMTQMLLETDESKFSLIVDSLVEAVIDLSKQAVRLYKQFLQPGEVRFARFTNNLQTRVDWNKDMLVEDITIKNRAKLATSDARRKQDLQQMLASNLLDPNNPLGPDLTMRLLEEFDSGLSINELPIKGIADVKKARRENNLIVNQGAQIEADDIDDHAIHYDVHTNFMKSDEYRKMVIANPQMDALMRQHMGGHQQIINNRNIQAQAQAIAMQGKVKK